MNQSSYYQQEQLDTIKSEIERITNAKDKLIFVAVAGIPGMGKSTFCEQILLQNYPDAKIIPMDGYHIYRKDLDVQGMEKRGAPFTFQKERFLKDLQNLKSTNEGSFPTFQHSLKDPVESSIIIDKSTKIVIIEGLYLFLHDWNLLDLFDIKIFMRGQLEPTLINLGQRHLKAGILDGIERANGSDRTNAMQVLSESNIGSGVLFVDI